MPPVINADQVFAFLLRKKEFVSYEAIHKFMEKVSMEDKDVIWDVCEDAVEQALDNYPEIFHRADKGIERDERAQQYLESDYVESCFINESNIAPRTRKIMDSVLEKMSL